MFVEMSLNLVSFTGRISRITLGLMKFIYNSLSAITRHIKDRAWSLVGVTGCAGSAARRSVSLPLGLAYSLGYLSIDPCEEERLRDIVSLDTRSTSETDLEKKDNKATKGENKQRIKQATQHTNTTNPSIMKVKDRIENT